MLGTDTRPFAAPAVTAAHRTQPETRRVQHIQTARIYVEGALTLEPTALPRLLRVLDSAPRVARLARAHNGQLCWAREPLVVSAAQWRVVHRGLLLCAGLAYEGSVTVRGEAGWILEIPASGEVPSPRRRTTARLETGRLFGLRASIRQVDRKERGRRTVDT